MSIILSVLFVSSVLLLISVVELSLRNTDLRDRNELLELSSRLDNTLIESMQKIIDEKRVELSSIVETSSTDKPKRRAGRPRKVKKEAE